MSKNETPLSLLSHPSTLDIYKVPQFNLEEQKHFFSFTAFELNTANKIHARQERIHFLLMLGYFKVEPVCLIYNWSDIKNDYQYIANQYYPNVSKRQYSINRFTRSRLYNRLFDVANFQRCDKKAEYELAIYLKNRVSVYADETQLLINAVEHLTSNNIAIPYYSTLKKLIGNAITNEENRIGRVIRENLLEKSEFMRLIESTEKQVRLNNLKKLMKTYKPAEIKKEIQRHEVLTNLSGYAIDLMDKLKLSEGNVRYFSSRCQQYNISDLRALKQSKTLIYLVCFVMTRLKITNDSLTQSFLVVYKKYDELSREYRDEKLNEQALTILKDIESIPCVLNIFVDDSIDDDIPFGSIRKQAFKLISKKDLPLVCEKLRNIQPDKEKFQWEYVDNNFNQIIHNLRPIFRILNFSCRQNDILKKQIDSLDSMLSQTQSSKDLFSLDGRLIKRNARKHLRIEDMDNEDRKTIANRNELYLYKLLSSNIQNGDVFIKESLEYRSFDQYLVDDTAWQHRDKHLSDAGLSWMSSNSDSYLQSLKDIMSEKITHVGERIKEGNNSFIKRKGNTDKVLWSRAVTAKDDVLTERFFSHFNRKSIVNVLRIVNSETGFLDHLIPESTRYKKSAASIENLLACIIANGTFQGTHKFSLLSGQQYKVLKRIEDECFHEAALRIANDAITGTAIRLPIFDDFKMVEGICHSSADGQRFESKFGNPYVGHSAKYYRSSRGGIVYTLVNSHFATHGKVISSRAHESHHLFDVIHNNTSDLKTNIIATDTHGGNLCNHAILNAFGYQFTPRYAGFKKRFMNDFKIDFDDANVLSLSKPIKWNLIKSEWDNITKIMLSLGMRTVQQSTLIKKLCGYKNKNTTMLALAEYNRVIKCLHMLNYADDKQLRQVISETLNRGESLQGLKRALALLGGNKFRGNTPAEMNMWNSCANLLANCIVYYNAMIMSSYKLHCIKTNNEDQIKYLRSISPASWENIILNGFYDLSDNDDFWDIESEIRELKLAA